MAHHRTQLRGLVQCGVLPPFRFGSQQEDIHEIIPELDRPPGHTSLLSLHHRPFSQRHRTVRCPHCPPHPCGPRTPHPEAIPTLRFPTDTRRDVACICKRACDVVVLHYVGHDIVLQWDLLRGTGTLHSI